MGGRKLDDVDVWDRAIGGFFGLAIGDIPRIAGSVWQAWTSHFDTATTFGTGRHAFAALIGAIAPRRLWLPAYYCPDVTAAASAAAEDIAAEVLTYGLTDELDPDVEQLTKQLSAGDMVIVVDFFGWPPRRRFRDWARDRPDVIWVEDRAQTLWTTDPPWAPWCVYSPRKLLGVPDGGVLLGMTAPAPLAGRSTPPDLTIALPELMRFEDTAERQNDRWYAAYKKREQGFAGRTGQMSRLTRLLLDRIPIASLVSARQINYRYLLGRLGDLAAWPRDPDRVAPFGMVIAVQDAQSVARQLGAERLFCARHWQTLTAHPARFAYEHHLSRQLLTLPCDQRYIPEQLARLADAIERLAPKRGNILRPYGRF